jgi:hypothetical protein
MTEEISALKQHLDNLLLPLEAQSFLLQLWGVIQFFDDVADGDYSDREQLNQSLWNCLISIPQNPFYRVNSNTLTPLIACAILKWQAADTVEREGRHNEQSFMWRACFYDIVLMVFALCFDTETATKNSHRILGIYGESLEDYISEFNEVKNA